MYHQGSKDIPVSKTIEARILISRYLAKSFNLGLENVYYPDILKVAQVVANNYRPISILLTVDKIYKIILHRRRIDF